MNDDHELEGADLLGDMTPASFHAPDDWWRQTIAGLDETARAKLLDGELSIVVMNGRGVEKVRLEPPEWVRGELGRAG